MSKFRTDVDNKRMALLWGSCQLLLQTPHQDKKKVFSYFYFITFYFSNNAFCNQLKSVYITTGTQPCHTRIKRRTGNIPQGVKQCAAHWVSADRMVCSLVFDNLLFLKEGKKIFWFSNSYFFLHLWLEKDPQSQELSMPATIASQWLSSVLVTQSTFCQD